MSNSIRGQSSILVDAPIQQLYAYLADLPRHTEWNANIYKITQMTPEPVGMGTRYRTSEGPPPLPLGLKAKMMFFFIVGLLHGVKPYSEAEITALEANRRIAWNARLARRQGDFNRAAWEISLEPRGNGTLVTQRFDYTPQHWAARAMVGRAAAIERSVAANLANLKHLAEQPSAETHMRTHTSSQTTP